MAGNLLVARRTYELPDLCVGDAALGRRKWILRRAATGRRRAGIVVDPIDKLGRLDLFANEIRCDQSKPLAFVNWNGRAVDATSKAQALEFGSPGFQIGQVSGGKAATLLDIEEDDRTGREPFTASGGGGGLCIVGDTLARVTLFAQLARGRSREKKNETEAFGA